MVRNVGAITSTNDTVAKVKILKQRRAMLLFLVGCTPSENEALKSILVSGFLVHVKIWLDDILSNRVGGGDLLLHLLSNISKLPVSKEMVTSSKLGKQVAAVEKHKICVGGMNEKAIKDRVSKVKEDWSASVKKLKKKVCLNAMSKRCCHRTHSSHFSSNQSYISGYATEYLHE